MYSLSFEATEERFNCFNSSNMVAEPRYADFYYSKRKNRKKGVRRGKYLRSAKSGGKKHLKVNCRYKDSLFRMLFNSDESRQDLLELYNGLNNSEYDNPEQLTINTINDVIYMNMKNDVSFIIDSHMVLLEHQSTFNPNMPLRGLFYYSELYMSYLESIKSKKSIYGPVLVKIPTPQFIVLYNGTDKRIADTVELRLSDSFTDKEKGKGFEWTAKMLNINYGHNEKLLLKCKKLQEYSKFIDRVRYYFAIEKDIDKAMKSSIDYCIENNILADFLKKHRAEVMKMSLYYFDKKAEYEGIANGYKEIGYAEGHEEGYTEGHADGHDEGFVEGHAEGHAEGQREGIAIGDSRSMKLASLLVKAKRYDDIDRAESDPDYRQQLLKEYNLI